MSFVCHAESCVNTKPGAEMYTYSSGTNIWFSPLWAATNSRLNSPAVNYYSCQLQGHMCPTYTQQGVSSCDTYSFVCEAGTGKLRKTRRKNSTYIMRPYVHSLCSKCGIMLLQVSSAQNVFFFPSPGCYEETHEGGASTFPTLSCQLFGLPHRSTEAT